MKNKDFDQLIKQQLKSLEFGPKESAWESFESRLDHELMEDPFDLKIKTKLQNTEEAYHQEYWYLFLNRLAFLNLFNKDLIYNKIFEALLLLLVLLFVLPGLEKNQQNLNPIQYADLDIEKPFLENDILTKIKLNEQSSYAEIDVRDPSSSAENTSTYTSAVASIQNLKPLPIINFFLEENSPSILNHHDNKVEKIDHPILSSQNPFPQNEEWETTTNLDFLLSPPLAFFNIAILCPSVKIPKYEKMTFLKGTKTIISVFSTIDLNTIHTPYDDIYLRNGYEQSKLGIGGGLSIGWNKGRWTLETGMTFSMKQYNPKKVIEIFRFNPNDETAPAISLRAIELNTLSIPLNARFDLNQGKKWTPYLLGGIGLNLATHANYQREQFIYALTSPLPQNAEINNSSTPKLEEKKFEDGLFQGGSLKENYFISFNSGIGVDYSLSKHWRLFTELNYHYNFMQKELGPNNDRINTFSLKLGGRHILMN